VFSDNGKFLREHRFKSGMNTSTFITSDKIVYVKKDENKNEILLLHDFKTGKEKQLDIFVARKNIIANAGGMRLVLMINSVKTFFHEGNLYYGKDTQYKIKKTDLLGRILLTFGIEGRKKIKITEEMKMNSFNNVRINGAPPSKEMKKSMAKGLPDEASYFGYFSVDQNGFIYVFRTRWENDRGRKLDIFSPRGEYLYTSTLVLPEDLTFKSRPVFYRDTLAAFVEDKEGEGKLMMFKIALPVK
jgi:hypothetical protein